MVVRARTLASGGLGHLRHRTAFLGRTLHFVPAVSRIDHSESRWPGCTCNQSSTTNSKSTLLLPLAPSRLGHAAASAAGIRACSRPWPDGSPLVFCPASNPAHLARLAPIPSTTIHDNHVLCGCIDATARLLLHPFHILAYRARHKHAHPLSATDTAVALRPACFPRLPGMATQSRSEP